MAANPKPAVAPSQSYQTITADRLTPTIGAVISGIDLSKPLSDQQGKRAIGAVAEIDR